MKYATLTWIKPAIDDTLKQARQSLEQFVENPDDSLPLQEVVGWLHEIRGSLVIMHIESAIHLIQEMELVTRALLDGNIADKEVAYDGLMRGMIQLPNYLDHLSLGYPDIPLAMLPLINKLRALCKQKPLAANQFFLPDVSLMPPHLKAAPKLSDEKLKAFAHKMYVAYHKGLIAWVKGPKIEGLKHMHQVMQHIQQATGTAPISKLWWLTEAIFEGLLQKGLAPSEAITGLFKQVDAMLKLLVERGNTALHMEPPHKVVSQMLYFIAHAKSKGPKITAAKQTYHLHYLLPSEAQLHIAQQVFSGPDIELMAIIATTIKEDFARIEETLDIFMRADTPDVADLVPLLELMHSIAYTLKLIGLEAQAKSMLRQQQLIKEISSGKKDYDLSVFLEVADALLKINAAMETLANRGTHARQQIQQEQGLLETQLKEVNKAAVDEAKTELAEVIQPIISFIDSQQVDDALRAIPARFEQICGLLSILSQPRAVKLLGLCSAYIAKQMVENAKVPEMTEQKALAEAIISLDSYLDTLAGNPMDGNRILDITQHCLQQLLPKAA